MTSRSNPKSAPAVPRRRRLTISLSLALAVACVSSGPRNRRLSGNQQMDHLCRGSETHQQLQARERFLPRAEKYCVAVGSGSIGASGTAAVGR